MVASQACSFRWLTSWVGISNLGDGENLQAMFFFLGEDASESLMPGT